MALTSRKVHLGFCSFVYWHGAFKCVSQIQKCIQKRRNASLSNTCAHTQTHTRTTQTTIGWHPDTLAVRTSNGLIEAIKPQRQRALLKPLLPAATDLHLSFFSLHPSISSSLLPIVFFHPHFLSFSPSMSVPLFLILLSCYEFDALPMGKHRG